MIYTFCHLVFDAASTLIIAEKALLPFLTLREVYPLALKSTSNDMSNLSKMSCAQQQ